MRLRRLETYGFKSFADRMSFDFEDGITAVIGPNGCGKSNVVDSIKWVIGEQSAKALRGEDMTDVIFNGCASRRAMAFAEVTLVLDQVGVALSLDAGDEIAITRRLTRDGLSSYFLNGKQCRLKDIKELFMGTGVGTSAYSVIEQGRIGFILDSNTKDRRLIIEEAAGISRYKARRKVALRKLERVQTDLQRIGEVLNEVKRRARAVARQAQAALRYRDLTNQVRELRMAFALEEFGRLTGEIRELDGRGVALTDRAAEASARLATLEAALAETDTKLVAVEADIRTLEQTRADTQSRRDVAESRAKDAKYRLVEIDQHEVEDRESLGAIELKLAALADEMGQAETAVTLVSALGADDPLSADMRDMRAELDRLLADVDVVVRRSEDTKAKQVECLRELSRIEAEQGRVESTKRAVHDRRGRLEDRSGGQSEALVAAMAAELQARTALEQAIIGVADGHHQLDDLIRAREMALAEGARLDSEINEIRHQEARAETGLRMLQEQDRRADGVFRGVKDVLAEMHRFPGIVGMVADLCRVDDEHVVAIETALGAQAQNIVTETQQAAKSAIDFLKSERRGRATFLPLDDIQGRERVPDEVLRESGALGVASQLVAYDAAHREAFEFLLGNVLVVESLDHAIAIRRRHRPRCRLVTLDGEVINPGGAMTGGKQQGAEAGGVVSRKSEIRKLEEQLQDLAGKRLGVGTARDEAKKQSFALSMQVEESRRTIQTGDRAVGEAKAQLAKNERDRIHLEQATSSFGAELEEIGTEQGAIEAELRDLSGQHEWFGALNHKLDHELVHLQQELSERAAARDRAQETVSNLRVSLATTQERQEAARNHLGHLQRSRQELDDGRQERLRRLAGHEAKRIELRRMREDSERVFAEDSAQTATLAEQLARLIAERDGMRDSVEGSRQEARALQVRLRGVEHEHSQIEVKLGEAKVRLEGISQRILDDYQLVLAEAFANYQRPADLDLHALRSRLDATDQELASLGSVNLAAIDELEEVQARETFLDKQFTDLSSAAEKLAEIIEQINDVSRKLFLETFDQVAANFSELFRKLFGGGRAYLRLEDPPTPADQVDANGEAVKQKKQEIDVLEAGLEIYAQPPGKNPKVITQLSGGEKALTAIALLFAVYRTKPSPFCILDEVDAPLDESNVDIYCNMVREFTKGLAGNAASQFIVITHKKRTMQRADAIYGITQNEPGVSTKISVTFDDVHQFGDTEQPASKELAETTRGSGPFAG